MKASHFNNAVLFLVCALAGQVALLSGTEVGDPPKLVFEPLSLTISKLDRDTFGRGVNPFQMFSQGAISGISLLVKVTPDPAFKARPIQSGTKLLSFRDDKGADLLSPPDGQRLDSFWEANQSLTFMPSPGGDVFGLQLRTPKTPSAGATKLIAEGTLSFASLAAELESEHGALDLSPDKVLEMEPVRLKFSQAQGRANNGDGWWVEVRPGPGMFDVAIRMFTEGQDDPIMDSGKASQGTRTMNGVVSHGFQCPDGKISRIVVRYAKQNKLIEVPFKLETGLGDFEGGGRVADRNRRLGPDPGAVPVPVRPALPARRPARPPDRMD